MVFVWTNPCLCKAKIYRRFALVAVAVVLISPCRLRAENTTPKCLYGSYTQGDETAPVAPCGEDAKAIGSAPEVLAVMRTFGLQDGVVIFRSCPGGRFAAMPDSGDDKRFLILYPSHVGSNFLAPIVHELAHVVQMRDAGGLAALNPKENSHRIELGADFLAGLAFNIALKHLNGGDFETNLELAGSYRVTVDHHGLPEHRTQAFRRGSNRKKPYPELTILEALRYWNANDYARIRR